MRSFGGGSRRVAQSGRLLVLASLLLVGTGLGTFPARADDCDPLGLGVCPTETPTVDPARAYQDLPVDVPSEVTSLVPGGGEDSGQGGGAQPGSGGSSESGTRQGQSTGGGPGVGTSGEGAKGGVDSSVTGGSGTGGTAAPNHSTLAFAAKRAVDLARAFSIPLGLAALLVVLFGAATRGPGRLEKLEEFGDGSVYKL